MVNTFLVSYSFEISASYLDRARLGKQRVEAYQILQILHRLEVLAAYFNIGPPPVSAPKEQRIAWRELVLEKFKTGNFYIIAPNIIVNSKTNLSAPKLQLGFVRHPAVLMWIGHRAALAEYLDAHIEEWKRRGYSNTMALQAQYQPKEQAPRPPWCWNQQLHDNHKASLLLKEKTRNEEPWYVNRFKNIERFSEYIWP